MSDQTIETIFTEERRYPPPPDFAALAVARPDIYEREFEEFWESEGRERVTWFEPFTELYEWELPYAKWYLGGKLNVAYNCVDRHVDAGLGDRVAYHWEGEPEGERREITYADLQRDVVRMANALKELGVGKGTKVAIYMGMIPELPVAMLACTRLGAPHTVVFGGFSADSLSDRANDMGCEVLITQDEAWRRGTTVPLKRTADDAMADAPGIRKALVVRRTGNDVPMQDGRDHWLHDFDVSDDPATCPPEPMDSEDLLFLMYTSGTTAKPKGIAHTTGGYLVGVASTHALIFDLKPEDDVYWCAADIGWITGHSYIVYGPLTNGTTSVLYEGTPDFPDKDRWWDIVERYGVTILYTAPTAIRAHMKWGPEHAAKHELGSLRLLGSVGEPINPEAWMWYREHVGGDRCPVVDTWWQTETGMVMITPLPGVTTTKPGSATKPFPGVEAGVFNEAGEEVGPGGGGYLVLKRPWPAMTRGIYGDDARFRATYWEKYPGVYFAGDGARIDEDGDFWLLGRVDDVMNVSGHRISTIEVESALVDHPKVAEAAVCGRADQLTGPGDRRLRDAEGRRRGLARDARGAAQPRRREDRPDREAGEHRLHARAAEDALRQDHAPAPPRRGGESPARRHDDPGRPGRRQRDRRPRRRGRSRVASRARSSRWGEASVSPVCERGGLASDRGGRTHGAGGQTEHPRHLGRRHRDHEPELLQRRADGLPDAQHRPDRGRGDAVHRLLRRAELHRRPLVVHHRPERLPHRPEQGRRAGHGHRPPGRGRHDRRAAEAARLRDGAVRQEPPRRPEQVPADRARLRRVLRQPLPPERGGGAGAAELAACRGLPQLQRALRPARRHPLLGDGRGRRHRGCRASAASASSGSRTRAR